MKRTPIDLGFYSDMTGRVGSLQTLGVIPVVGGDSVTINANHIFRLSPLRRTLLHDGQVDLFAFYVPHRHIYGTDWTDMIKEGTDSAIILPDTAVGNGSFYTSQMLPSGSADVAKWLFADYNRIWNRYFRFLKLTPEVPDDYNGTGYPTGHTSANSPIDGTQVVRDNGFPCARLKRPWTTGITSDIVAADHEVASATVLDLLDLYKQKQTYKTQLTRDWFSIRYNDLMGSVFGSGVNTDADERPTLLMRKKYSLSGRDVDGTDDATIGTHVSKSLNRFPFQINRKFCPEHGAIFLMALVRFPTIAEEEMIPQLRTTQDYLNQSADYNLAQAQEPGITNLDTWLVNNATNPNLGTIPFGQEWRTQPNIVHKKYADLTGFQFLKSTELNSHRKAVYYDPNNYDSVFSSEQLGHWQSQSTIQVTAHRHYPTAMDSIMAGTNKG
nr:MAG: major capsid protein [Microvirus sp.]